MATTIAASLLCQSASPGSLQLSWTAPVEGADLYDVHYSRSPFSASGGLDDTGRYVSHVTQEPSLVVDGLDAETTYHFRVRSHRLDGGQWDWDVFAIGNTSCATGTGVAVLPQRRGQPGALRGSAVGTRFQAVVRISELQDLPDFLSSKDAGDFAGDMAFVTNNALHPRFFDDFASSVINYHCVEILDLPLKWANYSSCNGQVGVDYTCSGCIGDFDKGVAHNDCTPGPELPPADGLGAREPFPSGCDCTNEAKSYSRSYAGRLPVYLPYQQPESENPELVGYWYSFPGDGECAFGAPVGTEGCTWRRLPIAQAMRGFELSDLGFLLPDGKDDPEMSAKILANAKTVEEAFRTYQPAGWGCGSAGVLA